MVAIEKCYEGKISTEKQWGYEIRGLVHGLDTKLGQDSWSSKRGRKGANHSLRGFV